MGARDKFKLASIGEYFLVIS